MCSIVMPSDYEMVVAHSPPIFSHSPPAGSLYESFPNSMARVTRFLNNSSSASYGMKVLDMCPVRPILVVRDEDSSPSYLHKKKKVVFADDRGMSLTHVRIMKEPSNVPPVWNLKVLSRVMMQEMLESEETERKMSWEVTFSQPASDYVKFRQQLEKNKVSLENVIVKDTENVVLGTVKVCNLSFEKQVFLRISEDSWKTHKDIECSYMPSTSVTSSAYALYDTFSFKFALPKESPCLNCCVRYVCNGQEFWDNNSGANYTFIKESLDMNNNNVPFKVDSKKKKGNSWGEYASWAQTDNSTPYW